MRIVTLGKIATGVHLYTVHMYTVHLYTVHLYTVRMYTTPLMGDAGPPAPPQWGVFPLVCGPPRRKV